MRELRIAAVGDVHLDESLRGSYRERLRDIQDRADVLLLAGDLTRHGTLEEAKVVADEFRDLPVPVVAVLGNHDHHSDRPAEIAALLRDAGIQVLHDDATVLDIDGVRLGVVGGKGFGGGYAGKCASDFGEREIKAFIGHTKRIADRWRVALKELQADRRVVLSHYSPVKDTLHGEPLEIYPFLGSYLLAEAADAEGADLIVHGHAHAGTEKGMTPGGIRVRNVALPVLGRAYGVYCL
ncbi:Icc-related predicted phosphoesterase [Streptosporangium becharense]|uniref:Icc-related predicted phosphoesterase n=1 Tax=Streptosporangium becharense TaxID=1816182 RepID=A0A7W9IJL0_9ACTN|nr:metallophosphoesterase [Streptosporangium becharense]MBB2911327.1 Icc-related predicted phosphoesterase [Streptosporangium becharense]MBB5821615.1 Icc-related predicted phosphoesterase [Streptosporangium becharense]